MKESYLYIREQMIYIKEILNNQSLSNSQKLDKIKDYLYRLHVEAYTGISQEAKQRIINIKNKLSNIENYIQEELLLEISQLVDYIDGVSE